MAYYESNTIFCAMTIRLSVIQLLTVKIKRSIELEHGYFLLVLSQHG